MAAGTSHMAGSTVLIVDDYLLLVELLREDLADAGCRVETSDGSDAVDVAARQDVDAVLLDVALEGVSGLDVLTRLKALPGRPSVVIMTGNGSEELASAARFLGADGYLEKPVYERDAVAALEAAIGDGDGIWVR